MIDFGESLDDAPVEVVSSDAKRFQAPRRERSRISRMIGRWPEGIRFEDAIVPREGFLRGGHRDVPGIWPESSLSLDVGISRGGGTRNAHGKS